MAQISNSPKKQYTKIENGYSTIQTVDFSTFRIKNSDITIQANNQELLVKKNSNYFLSMLVGLSLLYGGEETNYNVFDSINIINIPRAYVNYTHKMTLQGLFKIFKSNINSLKDLADTISYYPISSCFLEIYGRQSALFYLKENLTSLQDDLMGNQEKILNDFSTQLRGNALDILIKSLKLKIQIKYMKKENQKFVRKSHIEQVDQIYGNDDYNALIQVKYINKDTHFIILDNKRQAYKLKKSRGEFIQRKNKVKDVQLSRTHESRSIPKTNTCKQCGRLTCSCFVAKKMISPQNMNNFNSNKSLNQSLNSQKVIVPQQFNYFGFINLNKIMKN